MQLLVRPYAAYTLIRHVKITFGGKSFCQSLVRETVLLSPDTMGNDRRSITFADALANASLGLELGTSRRNCL